jgi:hypothetical protein
MSSTELLLKSMPGWSGDAATSLPVAPARTTAWAAPRLE